MGNIRERIAQVLLVPFQLLRLFPKPQGHFAQFAAENRKLPLFIGIQIYMVDFLDMIAAIHAVIGEWKRHAAGVDFAPWVIFYSIAHIWKNVGHSP